jgi:hypothetical protein
MMFLWEILHIKAMKNKGVKHKSGETSDENVHIMSVFVKNGSQEWNNICQLLVWEISK